MLLLGQAAFEFGFVELDRLHRLFDRPGDILLFGEIQQIAIASVLGKVETAFCNCNLMKWLLAAGALEFLILGLNRILMAAVVDVGEFEKDQAQHRRAIFRGLEVGVGAQVVGGGSEIVFELFELAAIH